MGSKVKKLTHEELHDLVIQTDSGARKPRSRFVAAMLIALAISWSLFQLWIASPLQFALGIFVLNDTETRAIHLAFALLLSFLAYPAFKRSSRQIIPVVDRIYAVLGAFCALYLYIFQNELAERSGVPTSLDIAVAITGLFLLLEATRRALGYPLVIIAIVFLSYSFVGSADFLPEVLHHKGQSLAKIANHQWLSTEGVFGIALGASSSFVFLYVLFGAMLDKAGAGNYFIKVTFALLGHMRGGPAKAAVISSAFNGFISGSSIANTVTSGVFTIPLMKRTGFSGEKAGAIEVSSSVNGQIMPPVMGAAAFLMVEYVGIPYLEVVKHAFIPATISYIGLFYIVHLEALKMGLRPMYSAKQRTLMQSLYLFSSIIFFTVILSLAVYYGLGWIKDIFPDTSVYIIPAVTFAAYVLLLKTACNYPELELDNPNAPVVKMPEFGPTAKSGLHYLLPIVVLVWCLMVERQSAILSAFWAIMLLVVIMMTQPYLNALFRKETFGFGAKAREGLIVLLDGLAEGARNMIGIGVATAAAGIIVGTVSLTGVGQVLTEAVELVSGDSVFLMLLLTAFITLILGMGLPTTANYIVVASLMSHVIVELGAANGLVVPLIAIHLFVFYFGIMADVTPPVGLASFAAAAISGADPIKTGLQGFVYSIRTGVLPFMFIYNTKLILVGISGPWEAIGVFIMASAAILIFTASSMGYFITRSKFYESIILLFVSFTIFVPKFWIDYFFPAYEEANIQAIEQTVSELAPGTLFRLTTRSIDDNGDLKEEKTFVTIEGAGSGENRLRNFGIAVKDDNGKIRVAKVLFNSAAEKARITPGDVITKIETPKDQPSENYSYIVAVVLFILVVLSQSARRRKELALKEFA